MSPRAKIIATATGLALLGGAVAFGYFGGEPDPRANKPAEQEEAVKRENERNPQNDNAYEYGVSLTASEGCTGGNGVDITLREPCQVLLTATPVTQDPNVAVAFFETTGGAMNPLFVDSNEAYVHGIAFGKEQNGEHSYAAQIVSKNDRTLVRANSNMVLVKVKIVNRSCGSDDGLANIPDPNLKKALLEEINTEFGGNPTEVDCAALESITKLNASRKNIHNLEGLQYAIELTSLNLSGNPLSSLDPLGTLEKLTYLNLTGVGQRDFGIVPGNNLRELYAGNNELNSLAFLGHFQKVSILSVFSNNISDVSPILNQNNLNSLTLYGNPVNYSLSSQGSKGLKALRDRGVDVLADDITLTLTTVDGNSPTVEAGEIIMLRGETAYSNLAKESGIKIRKIEIFEEKGGQKKLIRTIDASPFQHLLEFSDDAPAGIYRYTAKVTLSDGAWRETTESELVTITVREKTKDVSCQPKRITCGVDRDPFTGEEISRFCRMVTILGDCSITVLDCTDGVCVTKPDKTPFSFAGCPKLQQQMTPTGAETQTYDVALPGDQTCAGENFCRYITLCPKF